MLLGSMAGIVSRSMGCPSWSIFSLPSFQAFAHPSPEGVSIMLRIPYPPSYKPVIRHPCHTRRRTLGITVDASAISLSPIAMFAAADPVVKFVMLGLVAASVLSWWVIFSFFRRLRSINAQTGDFEQAFSQSRDLEALSLEQKEQDGPASHVLDAGLHEWRHSTEGGDFDLAGARERIATSLGSAVAAEVDALSDRLNVLATIGSVSPFVGLFGTVWGIMRSFTGIAAQQSTSLAVVAPGIAEALFATAIGLFAAIPAVIGYNRLSHGVNRVEARLSHLSDTLHSILSRRLETGR